MTQRRLAYTLHRWIGLVSCLFMLVVSLTALALNHADLWRPLFLKPAAHTQFEWSQARVVAGNPYQPGRWLAASEKALFQSPDNGQHWQELKLFVPAQHVSGLAFAPGGLLWVALRDSGVYFSDDGGEIWEELSLPFNPVGGEAIEHLFGGAGPVLQIKTNLAWYQRSANGSWQKRPLGQGHGRQALDLHDWIWRLHTGRIFGDWGVLLYDGVALCLIALSLSGLWLTRRARRRPLPRERISTPEPQEVAVG